MSNNNYYSNGIKKYAGEPHTYNDNTYDGTQFWKNGKIMYIGQWKNGKRNGIGTEFWCSGKLNYIGNWISNKRHGLGTSYNNNGKKWYQGEFYMDQFDGHGLEYRSDGTLLYDGKWKNDLYNGDGILYHLNGITKCYVGHFKDNKLDGDIIEYHKNGNIIYKGIMRNNKKNGFGIIFASNNNQVIYSGTFLNSCKHGIKCKEYDENGSLIYMGDYKNGLKNGYGLLYGVKLDIHKNIKMYSDEYLKSCYYQGHFSDDLFNGSGIIYNYDNKMIFKGLFLNNLIFSGKWYDQSGTKCITHINEPFNEEDLVYDENDFNNNCAAVHYNRNDNTRTLLNIDFKPYYRGTFDKNYYPNYGEMYSEINSRIFMKYKGEFQNSKAHGVGMLYDEYNRLIFKGIFNEASQYEGTLFNYKENSNILENTEYITQNNKKRKYSNDELFQNKRLQAQNSDYIPQHYLCPISKSLY